MLMFMFNIALIVVGWWLIRRAILGPREQLNLLEKKKLWDMQEHAIQAHRTALELQLKSLESIQSTELDRMVASDAIIREETAKHAVKILMRKQGASEEEIQAVMDAIDS